MAGRKLEFRQLDHSDCGAACLASVCGYYGLKEAVSRIRQWAGTDKTGTNLLGMIRAAKKLGLNAKAVRLPGNELANLPLPCICHLSVRGKWLHFVVLYGVSEKKVKIMDPARGKLISLRTEEFLRDFTHVVLLIEKTEDFEPGSTSDSLYLRFFKLVRPHRLFLSLAFLVAVLYSLLGISSSLFVKVLIDNILPSGSSMILHIFAILFLLLLAIRVYTAYLKNTILLKTGLKIDSSLILAYYRHIFRLPMNFFNNMQTGEIISRINDAVKIRAFINSTSLELVVNLLIVIFTIAFMMIYSPAMSLIIVLSIPLYFIFYKVYNQFNTKRIRRTMEHAAELESSFVESFKLVETIKTTGSEEFFTHKLDSLSARLLGSSFSVNKVSLFSGTFLELLSIIQTVMILWSGAVLVFRGSITTGELLSFYTLFGYMSPALLKLILSNREIQDALIAADRLFQIMDLETESTVENSEEKEEEENISITLEKINFSYPSSLNLLNDISLRICPSTITTITGESGSGKSTLLHLILNLEQSISGTRKINETGYENYSNSELRKKIGYIPQKPILIKGSLLQNIAFGSFNPDIRKVEELVKETGLLEKVDSLPGRLNTFVSEEGNNFSGGEKQKITIARVLYNSPNVLLFDEPTSGMDRLSEQQFIKLLSKLKELGKSILIVSHKESFKTISDRVFVLKEGKLFPDNPVEIHKVSNATPGTI